MEEEGGELEFSVGAGNHSTFPCNRPFAAKKNNAHKRYREEGGTARKMTTATSCVVVWKRLPKGKKKSCDVSEGYECTEQFHEASLA
jgi:hypothetical protein